MKKCICPESFQGVTFCREQFYTKKGFKAPTRVTETKNVDCPLCDSFLGNCYNLQDPMKKKYYKDYLFNVREY